MQGDMPLDESDQLRLENRLAFNYVDLKFDQNQVAGGATGGLNGTYLINHVVGGLSIHF